MSIIIPDFVPKHPALTAGAAITLTAGVVFAVLNASGIQKWSVDSLGNTTQSGAIASKLLTGCSDPITCKTYATSTGMILTAIDQNTAFPGAGTGAAMHIASTSQLSMTGAIQTEFENSAYTLTIPSNTATVGDMYTIVINGTGSTTGIPDGSGTILLGNVPFTSPLKPNHTFEFSMEPASGMAVWGVTADMVIIETGANGKAMLSGSNNGGEDWTFASIVTGVDFTSNTAITFKFSFHTPGLGITVRSMNIIKTPST